MESLNIIKRQENPLLDVYGVISLSLNTIYLTLITQKAQRTYKRVLEGTDVGVLWSYMVEETGEPGENHRPWTGDHYPATCRHRIRSRIAAVASECTNH